MGKGELKRNQISYNTGVIHGSYNSLNQLFNLIAKAPEMKKSELLEIIQGIKSQVGVLDNESEDILNDLRLVIASRDKHRWQDHPRLEPDSEIYSYANFD